jgi:triacylglycerol esterase/lipase EstA (alpha/beta hydrolase family)
MPIERSEGGRMAEAIVLLHGFGGVPVQTALLASRLRRAGYAVFNPFYPSWRWSLDRIVDHLHPRIAAFADRTGGPLHCVGHSMGGLVLRAWLARHRPAMLGRTVLVGTPNGGSEMADLLYRLRLHGPVLNRAGAVLRTTREPDVQALLGTVDYPLGVIAGDHRRNPLLALNPVPTLNPLFADRIFGAPHDGKVSVAATHVAGQADHIVMPVAHTAMLYSAPVAKQIVHFLRDGRFLRD